MAKRIQHRSPDDAGVWLNDKGDLALAHRRLSIIDLTPAGHQPMISSCGRFTLVYNGEIYNHQDLRTELEGEGGRFDWRGHSDIETLLAGSTEEWLESLTVLRDNPDLRKKMGMAGRRMVEERYCIQVTAPKLLSIFKDMGNSSI